MSSQRWLPFVLIAVFGLTACPPPAEEPVEEPPPAPEVVPEPMVQQEVAVMNDGTEPVTVTAMVNGRHQELGMVQPSDSATFTVTAERGARIEIEARDPQGEVVERETIEATEMRRDWRVGAPREPGAQPETTQR